MKWALVSVNQNHQNKRYSLEEDIQHDLGRGKECIFKCVSLYASRIHCKIFKEGDSIHVVDNKSSNGTFINGTIITPGKKVVLKENDILGIGVREILDDKSLVLKLIKENEPTDVEPSVQINGKRKRNEDESGVGPNKAVRVDTVLVAPSRENIDVNVSLPSSPPLCTSTPIANSKPPTINGSPYEAQSSHDSKGNVLEVIDLVDSEDEQDVKPNIQDIPIVVEEMKDDSVSKVVDTSGYADEDDVIVISDDEDAFFSSSQLSNVDNDAENEEAAQSEDAREKTEEKVWDASESDEESDNEWWPKLSQSFCDNTQEEGEAGAVSNSARTSGDEGECSSANAHSNKSDDKLSCFGDFVNISDDELEVDDGEGCRNSGNEAGEGSGDFFPVLSCGFSDSEAEEDEANEKKDEDGVDEENDEDGADEENDEDGADEENDEDGVDEVEDEDAAEEANDEEEVDVGVETGMELAEKVDKLDIDGEDEGELQIDEREEDSSKVNVSTKSRENAERISVSKCMEDFNRVRISRRNESVDGVSDDSTRSTSISSDVNSSRDRSSLDIGRNEKLNDEERRIILNAQNLRRGPQLVTPPMLKRGRICLWEEEKRKEPEPSEIVSSVEKTSVATSNLAIKNCKVILEDIMYGKKKRKTKRDKRDENSWLSVGNRIRSPGLLSKAEKNQIKEKRKQKLQALSDKEPKNLTSPEAFSPEGCRLQETDKISPDSKDRHGKVAAKVTSKNRGAFLTEFDIFASSTNAPGSKSKKKKDKGKEYVIPRKDKAKGREANERNSIEGDADGSVSPLIDSETHKKAECSSGILSPGNSSIDVEKSRKHGILRKSLDKKNKRVSFKEDPEVRLFSISPGSKLMPVRGKDLRAPPMLSLEADSSMNALPPTLSVVYDICRWNAHWLEEQRSKPCSEPPPVNLKNPLNPIVEIYTSYKEYFSSFYAVMMFELWAKVYKEWDQNFSRHQIIQVLLESAVDISESPVCPRKEFVVISCQYAVPERQHNPFGYPKVGDLCILELPEEIPVPEDGNTTKPTAVTVRVFAYVDSVKRNHSAPKIPDKDFGNGLEPAITFNMTLKLKKRPHKICIGKEARLKIVCQLLCDLRSFEALIELPKSSLARYILNPSGLGMKTFIPGNFRLKATSNLNSSQQKAVALAKTVCLADEPRICLIQGPPGTGKTKVIVSLLMELFEYENKSLSQKRKENKTPRILLCAPSNAAIDNVVRKLLAIRIGLKKENRFRLVRVGRLEAMNPAVRDISLQELTSKEVNSNSDFESIDLQVSTLQAKINSLKLGLDTAVTRNDIKNKLNIEAKIKEAEQKLEEVKKAKVGNVNNISNKQRRQLEQTAERNVLRCADIIATTLASCVNNSMLEAFTKENAGRSHFNCCIIDEACQSLELDSLLPLQLGIEKLVLVGDQEQLYPTVMSMVAKQYGLERSLFERLWLSLSKGETEVSNLPLALLKVQYRMHPDICRWPNFYVYNGILETPPELEKERMSPFLPFVVISLEFDQNDPNQLLNCNEAELVSKLYFAMAEKAEKRNYSIGVITPYQKQKNAIEAVLSRRRTAAGKPETSSIEVNTIDSFQGQERDIVILSCVRSYGIGFLGERRRINVALTRARRSLVVCGNFASLKDHALWNSFLTDGLSRGLVKCVSGSYIPNQKELLNLVLR